MLQLSCDIKIGEEKFDYVAGVQVMSAWKNLTDTAIIKMPRNLVTRNKMSISEQFKVGLPIEIKLGYDLDPTIRFTGYIDSIEAATDVVEIKCQDEMWKLKQGSYTQSWPNADVESILSFIKKESGARWNYEILGDKITLGHLMVEGLSCTKILQKLKDDFGIYSFFRQGKLIAGKPYDTNPDAKNKVRFKYGANVISWKDLVYKDENDVKVKVKLVNIKPDGTKEESVAGDNDGEERNLHFYNLSKADLDKQAEALIKHMKYSGYRGKFTAFGEPLVRHGDIAIVEDERLPGRNGNYYIDDVETTFGPEGMRQIITLGPKSE